MSGSRSQEPQDIAVTRNSGVFDPGGPVLRVDRLAAGGRGVARHEGLVWLVEGAVPGDRVRARAIRSHPSFVEALAAEIVEPSSLRRDTPCVVQATCGGCPWMVLDESQQRTWKQRVLVDSLERIGGFDDLLVDDTVSSPRDFGYRRKVELTLAAASSGEIRVGFHGSGAVGELVDVERCEILHAAAAGVLEAAREFFIEGPGKDDKALRDPRERVRLVVRVSGVSDKVLVALRGAPGPFRTAASFANRVARRPEVSGVVRLIGHPGRRGGTRVITLAGKPWIEESVGDLTFRLPAPVFFQVNPEAAGIITRRVVEWAITGSRTRVLELYGGVGVFGLALARKGADVTVCEADGAAVAAGRRAARQLRPARIRFVRSDVGRLLRDVPEAPEVVVANPPRSGFGRGVAEGIVRLAPRRIVIISCDPPTLGRDLRRLAVHGYRPTRVIPVDLFPQTSHIESVTLAEK